MCDTRDTCFIIIVIAASYQLYKRTGSCGTVVSTIRERNLTLPYSPTGGRDMKLTFLATTAIAFFGGLFAWFADAVQETRDGPCF